jgi:hypothetical protein
MLFTRSVLFLALGLFAPSIFAHITLATPIGWRSPPAVSVPMALMLSQASSQANSQTPYLTFHTLKTRRHGPLVRLEKVSRPSVRPNPLEYACLKSHLVLYSPKSLCGPPWYRYTKLSTLKPWDVNPLKILE